jgi:hypothetical protein
MMAVPVTRAAVTGKAGAVQGMVQDKVSATCGDMCVEVYDACHSI